MNKYELIFVGGIHGVGKDSFCESTLKNKGYQCHSASSLINNTTKVDERTDKQSKIVYTLHQNQIKLIYAIKDLIENCNGSPIAITGHFCLLENTDTKISPIPVEVFTEIQPSEIFVLQAPVKSIQKRLLNRDKKLWNTSFIKKFQNKELEHAQLVAKSLNVKLTVMDNQ